MPVLLHDLYWNLVLSLCAVCLLYEESKVTCFTSLGRRLKPPNMATGEATWLHHNTAENQKGCSVPKRVGTQNDHDDSSLHLQTTPSTDPFSRVKLPTPKFP